MALTVSNQRVPMLGSYTKDDCQFLLKPIQTDFCTVADKEQLIQSGQRHYSEMIHQEAAPTTEYTELFLSMMEQYRQQLADEVMLLAALIAERRQGDICLVSLARAGTPVGVLLQRALTRHFDRKSTHYSISIIRDRGIDTNALDYILDTGHSPESLVFVDGWTAKGVITRELHQSVTDYNERHGVTISKELFVISDIGGSADVAATYADYTIPSALMNSTVSGLISRSILNDQIGKNDFHGCVRYDHLQHADRSVWFVDNISDCFSKQQYAAPVTIPRKERQHITRHFLKFVQSHYQVGDINRIKPGIAEATRVMLRRVPDILLVQNKYSKDVAHLIRLCNEKQVTLIELADMPFGACAIIKDVLQEKVA